MSHFTFQLIRKNTVSLSHSYELKNEKLTQQLRHFGAKFDPKEKVYEMSFGAYVNILVYLKGVYDEQKIRINEVSSIAQELVFSETPEKLVFNTTKHSNVLIDYEKDPPFDPEKEQVNPKIPISDCFLEKNDDFMCGCLY